MRILILDTYYPAFQEHFYRKYPEAAQKRYAEQKTALFAECFGTADFYSTNLKKFGHDAEELSVNNEILQKQWAKEHGVFYKKAYFSNIPKIRNYFASDWQEKILEAQIQEFKPYVLYCQSLSMPNAGFLGRMKKHIKLIVGQVASHVVFDKKALGAFDLITTSFPHLVERFRKIGIASEYFKIGFEPRVLDKLAPPQKKYNTVFVGGISKRHAESIDAFEYLSRNTGIDFWGYGSNELPPDSPIREKHHGEAWGIEMYDILHNAKISVNRHIDAAENFANNMRLYESTGVGTMLITDHKDNLHELFEVGKEVETYRTKEELLEKIQHYLTHEEEREKIAQAGQQRTLKDHTYEIRMKELAVILEKYL